MQNTGRPLAQDYVVLFRSPEPQRVYCYSPGLAKTGASANRARLIATMDLGGPGVADLNGPAWQRGEQGYSWQGRVFTSDDRGRSWTHRAGFPYMHARPFAAGGSLYVLGQAGDLMIMRSDDGGESWGEPVRLTEGQHWHQAPSNVLHANGCVYLVMERRAHSRCRGWNISENAPVLMRARLDDDLTLRESWTFASEMAFCDTVRDRELDGFGVPFWPGFYPESALLAPGRDSAPIGWLETNVVQFTDPDHLWYDPTGRTIHLWMRAHTGLTNLACILAVTEQGARSGEGPMRTSFQLAPSGKKLIYVPCPGGQNKFHVLYDEPSRLYWLLSVQATDSLTRPDRLPPDRYNIPSNERRRLALHFSKNMWDWCFAGLVAVGPCEHGSRHYASMTIDGDDLHVLSRSGDEQAKNAHDTNMITFHTVQRFRDLAY